MLKGMLSISMTSQRIFPMENDKQQWEIILPSKVVKKIMRTQPKEQVRIKQKILALKDGIDKEECKRLQGRIDWRMKVGNWRVLFRIDFIRKQILITDFGSRGDVYK